MRATLKPLAEAIHRHYFQMLDTFLPIYWATSFAAETASATLRPAMLPPQTYPPVPWIAWENNAYLSDAYCPSSVRSVPTSGKNRRSLGTIGAAKPDAETWSNRVASGDQ